MAREVVGGDEGHDGLRGGSKGGREVVRVPGPRIRRGRGELVLREGPEGRGSPRTLAGSARYTFRKPLELLRSPL